MRRTDPSYVKCLCVYHVIFFMDHVHVTDSAVQVFSAEYLSRGVTVLQFFFL